METNQEPVRTSGPDRAATALGVLVIAPLIAALALAVTMIVHTRPTENDTRTATAGLPNLQQDLAAHEWRLDAADSSPNTRDPNPVTLSFGTDTVWGTAQCNRYYGSLSVDDDDNTITITDLAQTHRSCDDRTMRAEREYFAALRKVRDVDLSDSYNQRHLVLDNSTGDRLAFHAIDVNELLIGAWNIVNVATGDGIESVVDGTDPVIVFGERDLTTRTGCNAINADYQLGGRTFDVDSVSMATQKRCEEPDGVMGQETAIVRALESATRLEFVPGTVTIFDDAGKVVLVATAR